MFELKIRDPSLYFGGGVWLGTNVGERRLVLIPLVRFSPFQPEQRLVLGQEKSIVAWSKM